MLIEVVTMHVRLKYIFQDVMISYQIIANNDILVGITLKFQDLTNFIIFQV